MAHDTNESLDQLLTREEAHAAFRSSWQDIERGQFKDRDLIEWRRARRYAKRAALDALIPVGLSAIGVYSYPDHALTWIGQHEAERIWIEEIRPHLIGRPDERIPPKEWKKHRFFSASLWESAGDGNPLLLFEVVA